MKIHLVTHYYPPEVNAPAQRASDHARYWARAGHDVSIVTAQPSHPYGKLYEGHANRTEVSWQESVRVVRLKTILGANSGKVRRSLNYASFLHAVRSNLRLIGPCDVVISTSPQFFCGLSGKSVANAARAPWVLEIRDIWPDSIVAVGAAKASLATNVLSALADRAYRQCDRIVSVSPGFAAHFEERGVAPQKISLIPNGVKIETTPMAATLQDFPELAPIAGRFIAAYIGTFGMAHSVKTLLQAAALLKTDPHIGLLLVGSGAERDNLISYQNEHKLSNVVILDQQTRDRVAKLFALSSASIIHLKKQDVFKAVIPTKLLEGMAMGQPILNGVDGVARNIVERAGSGITFEPENPEALAEALRRLAADQGAARAFGEAGRLFVQKEFDREAMANRYLEVLSETIQRFRRRPE